MRDSPVRTVLLSILALAGGVVLWLLVEAFLERRQVPEEHRMELEQRSVGNLADMQEQLTESLRGRTQNEAQARMDSPHGLALSRLCAEWTDFHENHPDEDSLLERDAACQRLKDYVEGYTGED